MAKDPCTCPDEDDYIFTQTSGCTFCDGDRRDNVWIEGNKDENGNGGICMLDGMTKSNLIYILERDERARADLKRVTTNVDILELAEKVPRLRTDFESDRLQSEINKNEELIMYSHFRGQPPFNQ